jgi:hypothetical protein
LTTISVPLFLAGLTWAIMDVADLDAIDQIIYGSRGERPSQS